MSLLHSFCYLPVLHSAFFQIKSACDAAEPANSDILASNHVLHKTVHYINDNCQPCFAQNRGSSIFHLNTQSNLILQIARNISPADAVSSEADSVWKLFIAAMCDPAFFMLLREQFTFWHSHDHGVYLRNRFTTLRLGIDRHPLHGVRLEFLISQALTFKVYSLACCGAGGKN